MQEITIAVVVFICLIVASLGSLTIHHRLPDEYRSDDTQTIVRLIATFFIIMTSLVLGLMVNAAKNTFESVDRSLHAYAANLIILDRTLRQYGPEAATTRDRLLAYVQRAEYDIQRVDSPIANRTTENLLAEVGKSLKLLKPQSAEQLTLWQNAQQQLQRIVELRWTIVGQSDGAIPKPIVLMLAFWLVLIFASFGYRAPRNAVVAVSLVLSSLLVAAALYLILDMDAPFSGPISVSIAPLQRAIAEMQ